MYPWGLFDRLRGNDTPRVAFIGIDGLPTASSPTTRTRFRRCRRSPTRATGTDRQRCAARVERVLAGAHKWCEPRRDRCVRLSGPRGRLVRHLRPDGPRRRRRASVGPSDRGGPQRDGYERPRHVPAAANGPAHGLRLPRPTWTRPLTRRSSGSTSPRATTGCRSTRSSATGRTKQSSSSRPARRSTPAREAFSRYVEMDDWDLFVGVFSTPDRINHFLWGDYEDGGPYREDMLAFYAALDEHIGNIRKALPRTTFGSSSAPRTGLRDSDTTCTATSGSNARGGSRTKAATTTDRCPTSPATPARTRWSPDASTSTWRAASPTASSPSRSTRRSARELRAELEAWEGPNGNPVAKRVVERETVFRGDHDAIAPDLVVIPHEGFDLKSGFRPHDAVFDPDGPRTGMHTFEDAALFIDHPDAKGRRRGLTRRCSDPPAPARRRLRPDRPRRRESHL